jgi:Ca2+-binding RTX toxin-like protein
LLLGGGKSVVAAAGADTIHAGSGSALILGGGEGVTVAGGAGGLYFVGGAGAVSVAGGAGNTTMFGGFGAADTKLIGGKGLNYMIGGLGTGNTTLTGGAGSGLEFAAGAGATTLQGGAGNTTMVGVTGTGTEVMQTGTGVADIGLNNNQDMVLGGTGASTVIGGLGPDLYAFIGGHAGGSEVILNYNPSKDLVFFGPQYEGAPVASQSVQEVQGFGKIRRRNPHRRNGDHLRLSGSQSLVVSLTPSRSEVLETSQPF